MKFLDSCFCCYENNLLDSIWAAWRRVAEGISIIVLVEIRRERWGLFFMFESRVFWVENRSMVLLERVAVATGGGWRLRMGGSSPVGIDSDSCSVILNLRMNVLLVFSSWSRPSRSCCSRVVPGPERYSSVSLRPLYPVLRLLPLSSVRIEKLRWAKAD